MKLKIYYLLFLPFLLFAACKNDGGGGGYIPPKPVSRTLFIYMAADNSLGYRGYDQTNLQNMILGATKSNMNGGKIIVFHDAYTAVPRLLEVSAGSDGSGSMKLLKTYDDLNSADLDVYTQAINDMKRFAPADSYGMILWSHGTGWMPKEFHNKYAALNTARTYSVGGEDISQYIRDPFMNLPTKAFGQDGSDWMDVEQLAAATPAGLFDFIVFDACLMSSAEVCYAFRNKTDYLVVSPAEVLAEGLPYDKIIKPVFSTTPVLGSGTSNNPGLSRVFYEYYNTKTGSLRSVTTAVLKTSVLDELAGVMRDVFKDHGDNIPSLNTSDIMVYDRHSRHSFYDIREFVVKLAGSDGDLIARFDNAMDKLVEYKATSGRMIDLIIDPDKYCGLSIYIPGIGYDDLDQAYTQTSWYSRISN